MYRYMEITGNILHEITWSIHALNKVMFCFVLDFVAVVLDT